MELLGYGTHLMIDGYDGDRGALAAEAVVKTLLSAISKSLEPQKTAELETYKVKHSVGISALASLPESHVSVHTFPDLGSVSLKVFTRYQLSLEAFSTLLNDAFQCKRIEHHLSNHSKVMPIEPSEKEKVLLGDRQYSHLRLASSSRGI